MKSETIEISAAAVQRGDVRACGRLISRIEMEDDAVVPVLQQLYVDAPVTPVIGVTGPPGAGKSTLVDQLIAHYRARGLTLAVLLVDPASPFSGGAILGDRVRMGRHNSDAGVFIRSMSSRGVMGGLSRAAAGAVIVLAAMNKDLILIETVGVGQTEVDVMRHASSVVVVQTPSAGDHVQAIKSGIAEIGDVFVVNKADAPGADRAAAALRDAIALRADRTHAQAWTACVLKTTASEGTGIEELADVLARHQTFLATTPGVDGEKLRERAKFHVTELVARALVKRQEGRNGLEQFAQLIDEVAQRRTDPYRAAALVLEALR